METLYEEGPIPGADERVRLYRSVGWTTYTDDPAALREAIARSTYVATARREGALVALARGLSDDFSIFYLQDLLVDPHHQGEGIGSELLQRCLERFSHVRQKVLLTDAEEGQHRLYSSAGYRDVALWDEAELHAFVRIDEPRSQSA